MLTLKDLGKVDEGDSWQKLNKDIEAVTDNESQQLSKLTEIVLEGFINRLARESTGKKKIIDKKGIKRSPESRSQSFVLEEKEDYVIRKQKKQKTSANDKKQRQKTGNNKEKEQKQKQKTCNEKKQNLKNTHDPIIQLTALGLEPPPNMPEAFKNRIETLGGTEIKLVIQKFIQVTDLKRSQNRLSMTINQLRSKFLSEAEEEKVKNKEGIDVIFVEPCLEVSKLHLNKWLIGNSFAYVFNSQWNDVVTNNADSLKPMAVVQIWSFRVRSESKLGFAMIKVREGEDDHVI